MKNAMPRRRAEFRAGRASARAALLQYGIQGWDLVPDERRRPIWPAGVVGSITHCERYCAVAIAWRLRYLAIGIDAEEATPLPPQLRDLICTRREDRLLRANESDTPLAAKVVFCAKEAFYKAYSAVADEFLDFTDVEVVLDFSTARFTARCPRAAAGPAAVFHERTGRFAIAEGFIFTALAVDAAF